MRLKTALPALVSIAVIVAVFVFVYLEFVRDKVSGHNITVTVISKCDHVGYLGTPVLVSRRWNGNTFILEVNRTVNCGYAGRLTAASYSVAGRILMIKWTRFIDLNAPQTACDCISRLRFKLVGLERKDYEIRLIADDQTK
jgi:hypothetical protein